MIVVIKNHNIPRAPVGAVVPQPAKNTKFANLRRAVRCWIAAGRPITPRLERRKRAASCKTCEHWSALGNVGLGECKAPGCGCTRGKWWLATERCPLGKW